MIWSTHPFIDLSIEHFLGIGSSKIITLLPGHNVQYWMARDMSKGIENTQKRSNAKYIREDVYGGTLLYILWV